MTTRCPHCGSRLRYEYTTDDSWDAVTLLVSGLGGIFFAVAYRNGDLPWMHDPESMARLGLGSLLVFGWLFAEGAFVRWLGRQWMEQGGDEPGDGHPGGDVGDAIRQVDASGGRVRYLREAGYHVPPEPERGALAKWLWAVVDGKVTFSQRGARTVHPDNERTRNWANDVMALWCHAGWCRPAHGWNGDEPVLDGGVREVDMEMIRRCASGGQMEMIAALLEQVDREIEERRDGMD